MSKKNLKRNDSLIGLARRKRRRNMIQALPILAAVVGLVAITAYVYSVHGPKAMVLHIHPHLSITYDGQPLTIPSQITHYGRIIL